MTALKYAVITPAYNEAAFIEKTLSSMTSQSFKPEKWVIVSDGSTDGTDDIVLQYIGNHPWIELVRMPVHRDRHFAAKVRAFQAGYQKLKHLDFNIVGNLDADISFEPDFMAYLIAQFSKMPDLGVAGTAFIEDSKVAYNYAFTNIEHVSGQCQMFRRECFEQIGGYTPVKGGGIDWIAVTTARMRGWQTRTFPDKAFVHHRTMGTGSNNALMAYFKHGQKDYFLGGHPLWQLFRSAYQATQKPFIIGGALLLLGYLWGCAVRLDRPVGKELMRFNRKEQMHRLRAKLGLD